MIGIPRPHLRRTPFPARDYVAASGHGDAVVETEVTVLLAHVAPVRRIERRRTHPKNLQLRRTALPRFHVAGNCFTRLHNRLSRSGTAGEISMAFDQGLVRATACAIVDKLNKSEVTPLDLLDALEQRIAEVDGQVNALPTLCFERARSRAEALMKKPLGERGLLAGMPVPIKDLTNVAGVKTTQGSPIYKDRIATESDVVVERLENNGAVIYAKSNTPEFGAGANTFNEVFGATLNPWDLSRSAAGSSGGAAAALATGMAWLAHGTDMGGSLRNPASFCGVVGLRPSIGRVAHTPTFKIDRNLTVHGPMARNVEDLALLLDAMSGEHPADPLSLPPLPSRSCPPRAPATSRSASPIRPISASPRSILKSPPSPGKPPCASPKPASSSRKRIRTCARPMNAFTCCARSISPSARRRCCGQNAIC